MEYLAVEIKRFLKDYFKVISIGALLIAIIFVGVTTFQKTRIDEDGAGIAEMTDEPMPGYYTAFLEFEDGTEFENASIVEEYFKLDSVKEDLHKVTAVNIKQIEELQELNDSEEDDEDEEEEQEIIEVNRNSKSNLWTFTFNVGNETDNLAIANYYYDLLLGDQMPFLSDKKIYIFEEPGILEMDQEDEELIDTQDNQPQYIKNIVIGYIYGIAFMIVLLVLKVLFGKKLEYVFGYEGERDYKFALYDPSLENEALIQQFVAFPRKDKKVVLSERNLSLQEKSVISNENQTSLVNVDSLVDMSTDDIVSEVILVVQPQETTRRWYKEQLKLAELQNARIKVIQLNPKIVYFLTEKI